VGLTSLPLAAVLALAQAAEPPAVARQREAAAKQLQAIEKQREAVRKLVKNPEPAAAFFSAPWQFPRELHEPVLLPQSSAVAEAGCDPVEAEQLEKIVAESASRNALTPELLRAVIARESSNRPCAVSRAGAMGLMQLMPATAAQFKLADPFDPAGNVAAGASYLRQMLDRYGGDLMLALGAYNAGPGRVDAAGGIPAIRETRDYVTDILSRIR
jgi:soluble lytic murein transglycosylase-like protein